MKSIVLSAPTAHLIHFIFEWTSIAIGVQVYRWQRARAGVVGILENTQYAIIIGCILGAGIGNKLVFWIEFPHLWHLYSLDMVTWMSGQSIVGGLLGGLLGVEIAKKLTKQTQSTGDYFVLPLIVGTAIGRIGCFLAGLHDGTFGNATTLPWGLDFGDGVLRHPTQLYDIVFVMTWGGFLLHHKQRWQHQAGLLFKLFLSGYLFWRLLVDAIKPIPYHYGLNLGVDLSGIQVVCVIALLIYLPLLVPPLLRSRHLTP